MHRVDLISAVAWNISWVLIGLIGVSYKDLTVCYTGWGPLPHSENCCLFQSGCAFQRSELTAAVAPCEVCLETFPLDRLEEHQVCETAFALPGVSPWKRHLNPPLCAIAYIRSVKTVWASMNTVPCRGRKHTFPSFVFPLLVVLVSVWHPYFCRHCHWHGCLIATAY